MPALRLFIPKRSGPRALARGRGTGFTLVELLVAAAVLMLLVVLVAAILQSGNQLIARSSRHLGADAQAREVFSRFGLDLEGMPRRADLDLLLSSTHNALFFFSQAPGYFASTDPSQHSPLSLIGYRVNAEYQLERLGKGLTWEEPVFLTGDTNLPEATPDLLPASTIAGAWGSLVGTAPAHTDGSGSDYHLLARGVFRIVCSFRKRDGTHTLTLPANADPRADRLREVSAIILTLAVLDDDSRRLVPDPAALAAALPDPALADPVPGRRWQAAVDDVPAFAAAAGIPEAVAARVRIYERSFPVDPP